MIVVKNSSANHIFREVKFSAIACLKYGPDLYYILFLWRQRYNIHATMHDVCS